MMILVVYQYATGNPGFFNVYSPVGAFDLYGFHDTNVVYVTMDVSVVLVILLLGSADEQAD